MKRLRLEATGAILVILVPMLTACSAGGSSAGNMTCAEWLKLPAEVSSSLSGQRADIVKNMLREHHASTGPLNRAHLAMDIVRFCHVDDGGNQPNADQPIDKAAKWE
ncbi:MAG: hypothetical protein JST33_11955 [Actinobacteria bacterium]|nr:hypothetical protein [Actinomycetota bacterium]